MDELQERLKRIRFIACDVDGVLTDGQMWFDGEGRPFRALHVRDGTAFTLWHLSGGKSALISGLGCKAIEAIAAQWRCHDCRMFIKDKAAVCRELAQQHDVSLDEMAFLGDDLIDRSALRVVGLAVAVADADSAAKNDAHWVTQSPGGNGAFRELVYAILRAKGELESVLETYCTRKNRPTQ